MYRPITHPLLQCCIDAEKYSKTPEILHSALWLTITQGYAEFCRNFPEMLGGGREDSSVTPEEKDILTQFRGNDPYNHWPFVFHPMYRQISSKIPSDTSIGAALEPRSPWGPVVDISVISSFVDLCGADHPGLPRENLLADHTSSDIVDEQYLRGWEELGTKIRAMKSFCSQPDALQWLCAVEDVISRVPLWPEYFQVHSDGKISGHVTKFFPFNRNNEISWNLPSRHLSDFPCSAMRRIPFRWTHGHESTRYILHTGILGTSTVGEEDFLPVKFVWSWAVTST
jgi:hypothetical protein